MIVMSIGDRIEALREPRGFKSQSALARAASISQSTLNGLIRNNYQWSPHLPAIAQALRTSVNYLVGQTDDPDANAPVPATTPEPLHHVMLAVALPGQRALARMFQALFDAMPPDSDLDTRAQLLAEWLPAGLSQLRDIIPSGSEPLLVRQKELAVAQASDAETQRS